MQIVNKPTAELKPYDKNAKKHDLTRTFSKKENISAKNKRKQQNATKGESYIKQ